MISFMTAVRTILNVGFNSSSAYSCSRLLNDNDSLKITIVVAIDTIFRLVITHILDALKIPYLQTGTAGHLLFPCLTLLTQPLSVGFVQRFSSRKETELFNLNRAFGFIKIFGYIALGWKLNMMVKDIAYLAYPSLKPT